MMENKTRGSCFIILQKEKKKTKAMGFGIFILHTTYIS